MKRSLKLPLFVGLLTAGVGAVAALWPEPARVVQAPAPVTAQQAAYARLTRPHALATWPWPGAKHSRLAPGVEHWHQMTDGGQTSLDLLSFDFAANPRLRFELFDADLANTPAGQKPANRFAYWEQGPGVLAAHMNERGDVLAAWNGSYWGLLNKKPRSADRSFHLSPLVKNGQVYYPGLNRRWTWGAKMVEGRPQFALLHAPNTAALQQNYDFATGTLQALLKDGHSLRVEAYPWFGAKPKPGGLPSTPQEAGHISVLDHMHTSRVGAGWTASGRLFVVLVKERDGESASRAAVMSRRPGWGGWTLQDHQDFWLALQKSAGVQNAVGLDGGDVAQAFWRLPQGKYQLLVPHISLNPGEVGPRRLLCDPQFAADSVKNLKGGALNSFLVRLERETSSAGRKTISP